MVSKCGSVAVFWLAIAIFIVAGTANASAEGGISGVDADGQPGIQRSEIGNGGHSKSELFTIGTLTAFAFVTAATALLTVRNHEDR